MSNCGFGRTATPQTRSGRDSVPTGLRPQRWFVASASRPHGGDEFLQGGRSDAMRNALTHRLTRSRRRWWIAAVMVVATGVALSASVVQGRVDPMSTQPATAAMSQDTVAIVTGGGTVVVTEGAMNVVASFGLNARRPDGFTGGGPAAGRVNYDEHANVGSRHVNAPVA